MSIPKDPSSISLCAAYLGIINKTKAAGRDVESVLLFGSDAYAVEQIGPRFTDRVLFLNCHTIPWVHHTLSAAAKQSRQRTMGTAKSAVLHVWLYI